MKIWFDMDGTIADLYGVENWLQYLLDESAYPYRNALPIGDIARITELLVKCQMNGIEIGIISWLSKNSNRAYDTKVRNAKYSWLKANIKIDFDTIHIVKYGTCKNNYCESETDILFDDEIGNRENWQGKAYTPNEIIEVLTTILGG